VGILEIIHTDICGSFPLKFVDDFNSFIIFTDDISHYDYIYLVKERWEVLTSTPTGPLHRRPHKVNLSSL
jgi:hypothetical protein